MLQDQAISKKISSHQFSRNEYAWRWATNVADQFSRNENYCRNLTGKMCQIQFPVRRTAGVNPLKRKETKGIGKSTGKTPWIDVHWKKEQIKSDHARRLQTSRSGTGSLTKLNERSGQSELGFEALVESSCWRRPLPRGYQRCWVFLLAPQLQLPVRSNVENQEDTGGVGCSAVSGSGSTPASYTPWPLYYAMNCNNFN